MSVLGYALVVGGVILVVLGSARARGPWRRYRELRAQDENAARYRAWRGGLSRAADEKTGASIAMQLVRREARTWAAVATLGVGLVVGGFILAVG